MEYSATPTSRSTAQDTLLYAFQRLPRLGHALPCHGTIVEVFPQAALLLEIDLDGRLAAGIVNDELNAFYHLVSFHG